MIRTAVFPVAGMGVRFLPATKSTPKEMFPIIDKPLIQYAIDEALAAGASRLVFITSSTKPSIKDYFSDNLKLESRLTKASKIQIPEDFIDVVPSNVECIFINQDFPLGLGHAILCAENAVGDEPFFVHLVDDLIYSEEPCLLQMKNHFDSYNHSIISVEKVPIQETSKYGIVELSKANNINVINSIVEKPDPIDAPSDMAVVGRDILTPKIFNFLADQEKGKGNEIQLTDAISKLLLEEQVHAFVFDGIRYDCGSKLGYLKANIEYGLRSDELGNDFLKYLLALKKESS